MTALLWGLAVFLLANASLCLLRAYLGPTAADRLLAVNVVGTKTLVVLCLLSFVFERSLFVDVALQLQEETIIRTRLRIQRYARDISANVAIVFVVLLLFVAALAF